MTQEEALEIVQAVLNALDEQAVHDHHFNVLFHAPAVETVIALKQGNDRTRAFYDLLAIVKLRDGNFGLLHTGEGAWHDVQMAIELNLWNIILDLAHPLVELLLDSWA